MACYDESLKKMYSIKINPETKNQNPLIILFSISLTKIILKNSDKLRFNFKTKSLD